MLFRFIKKLAHIVSPANLIQKIEKDENGICYVTGMRRYLSILIDLMIVVIFLTFFGKGFNYFFLDSEDIIATNQVFSKYSMNIPLSSEEETVKSRYIRLFIFSQVIQLLLSFFYVIYMWVRFAATLGKFLFGLRVLDSHTLEKITYKQALKRCFFSVLSIMPLFLGFVYARFNKRCQTWHDKVAGTVVVINASLQKKSQ